MAPPVVFQGLAISTSTGCPAGALLSSPASCAALLASCHVASSSCGKRYACHCFLCCPSGLTFPPACRRSSSLQQYEKNVRKGLLNDATIGLWDTAALQVRRLSGMLLLGSLLVTWSGCVVRCFLYYRFTCLALPYQHARTTSRKCILTTCWRPKPTYNCVPLLLFSEYAGGAHPRRPAAAHPGPHRPVPPHPAASHARAQGTAARVDCVVGLAVAQVQPLRVVGTPQRRSCDCSVDRCIALAPRCRVPRPPFMLAFCTSLLRSIPLQSLPVT